MSDNTAANGEADTAAGYVATVQALEHAEDPIPVFGRDPNSVIRYGNQPLVRLWRDGDVYSGRFGPAILQSMPVQILQPLNQMSMMNGQRRQLIPSYLRSGALNQRTQRAGNLIENSVGIRYTGAGSRQVIRI